MCNHGPVIRYWKLYLVSILQQDFVKIMFFYLKVAPLYSRRFALTAYTKFVNVLTRQVSNIR